MLGGVWYVLTCVVLCVVLCVVFLPSCSCAPAVCYSKREPNIKEYWEFKENPSNFKDPAGRLYKLLLFFIVVFYYVKYYII